MASSTLPRKPKDLKRHSRHRLYLYSCTPTTSWRSVLHLGFDKTPCDSPKSHRVKARCPHVCLESCLFGNLRQDYKFKASLCTTETSLKKNNHCQICRRYSNGVWTAPWRLNMVQRSLHCLSTSGAYILVEESDVLRNNSEKQSDKQRGRGTQNT